jgi:putative endonuclease
MKRAERILCCSGTTNYNRFKPIFVTLNLFQGPFHSTNRSMPIERNPCVYILASGHYGTLYIGVTSDLMVRLWQHRNNALPGFTSRYGVYRLVHFEMFGDMERAIAREKQLKNWRREWKINLINGENPEWRDLAVGLGFEPMALRARRNRS